MSEVHLAQHCIRSGEVTGSDDYSPRHIILTGEQLCYQLFEKFVANNLFWSLFEIVQVFFLKIGYLLGIFKINQNSNVIAPWPPEPDNLSKFIWKNQARSDSSYWHNKDNTLATKVTWSTYRTEKLGFLYFCLLLDSTRLTFFYWRFTDSSTLLEGQNFVWKDLWIFCFKYLKFGSNVSFKDPFVIVSVFSHPKFYINTISGILHFYL